MCTTSVDRIAFSHFIPALVIPAAYHSAKSHQTVDGTNFYRVKDVIVDGTDLEQAYEDGLKTISRGTAILLLIVYVAYLWFQVSPTKRGHL